MKKRSLFLSYILVWVTLGIYFFIWLFISMRDINNYRNNKIFNIKKRISIVLLIVIGLIMNYSIPYSINISKNRAVIFFIAQVVIQFIIVILWFITIIKNILDLSGAIKDIEQEKDIEKPIDKVLAGVLSILTFASIIYIQDHINLIVDKST